MLEIALVKPRKRRRWKWLAENHPEIMQRVRESPSFDWILDEADLEGSYSEEADEQFEIFPEF